MYTDTADVANAAGTDRAGPADAGTAWRRCEFCDCKTNAGERICCRRGRDADRKNWDRAALLAR